MIKPLGAGIDRRATEVAATTDGERGPRLHLREEEEGLAAAFLAARRTSAGLLKRRQGREAEGECGGAWDSWSA
jgi:hypothetical protein